MAFPINPSPGDSYTDGYGTVWVYAGTVNGWYRQSVTPGNETDYRTGDGYVGSDLDVLGDLTLDDGGTYATTLQLITPTAARTISFPDATGTVGLVGGSSGQLVYNNAGAYAGAPSTSVGATGNITLSLAGAASTPPVSLTGTWFSGGTATTTKPQLLIEPVGTTSTAWSTSGTGLGVNAASAFTGRLFDFQVNGSSKAVLDSSGRLLVGTSSAESNYRISTVGYTPSIQVKGAFPDGSLALTNTDEGGVMWLTNAATQSTANSSIGTISFNGFDGTNYLAGARIQALTDGTCGSNDLPTRLVFSVTADGASSPTEALRISNDRSITVSDGGNIVVGTTTGTKIGTATSQKIGFFDATPVVQPTTGVAEAAFVENSGGTAVNVDSTFGGYTLQQVVQALQNLGILA